MDVTTSIEERGDDAGYNGRAQGFVQGQSVNNKVRTKTRQDRTVHVSNKKSGMSRQTSLKNNRPAKKRNKLLPLFKCRTPAGDVPGAKVPAARCC